IFQFAAQGAPLLDAHPMPSPNPALRAVPAPNRQRPGSGALLPLISKAPLPAQTQLRTCSRRFRPFSVARRSGDRLMIATMTAAALGAREGTFFGEPGGLAYLSFTEAWERFSYYGMTALLVLYMTQQLLLPGHVEHIAGFAAFRSSLEGVFGPMTTLALASQIVGLYTGLVYFTLVLGGVIADRIIGRRTAVILEAAI